MHLFQSMFCFTKIWWPKWPDIYIMSVWISLIHKPCVEAPPSIGTISKHKATKSRWIPANQFALFKFLHFGRSASRSGPSSSWLRVQSGSRTATETLSLRLDKCCCWTFIRSSYKHNGLPLLRRNTRKLISKWLPRFLQMIASVKEGGQMWPQ